MLLAIQSIGVTPVNNEAGGQLDGEVAHQAGGELLTTIESRPLRTNPLAQILP